MKAPLPPGARPDDGGGRINHSTNLQSRQPAGFGYVQQQQCNGGSSRNGSSSGSVAGLPPMDVAPTTPASNTTLLPTSGQVNSQALQNLNKLGSTFDSVVARLMPREAVATPNASTPSEITMPPNNPRKRKHQALIAKATKKKKELEEQIAFMRPMKDDSADNMLHFNDITRQYIAASKEVVQLINETNIDDEDGSF